jgi:hypothetical protein
MASRLPRRPAVKIGAKHHSGFGAVFSLMIGLLIINCAYLDRQKRLEDDGATRKG